MSQVYQCCYTNATREIGGVVSSGWQTVAESPDLPPAAGRTCSHLQSLNSAIQGRMVDEDGQVLNLWETAGDGTFFYVMRTQYGLTDRVGRPNMFSHAYIFPLDGSGALQDPNVLLTLERENFKSGEEEAAAWNGSLSRAPSLNLSAALQAAGLDRERYITLVRCVYAQMSERSPRPLYVQYDGTEEQLRAALYCIYYGIPYYMRKKLSTASAPALNDLKKNLVFTRSAKERERWLVLRTGENNLLDSRTVRKIERYGYIDHAARELPAADMPQFFSVLDWLCGNLGDPSASNELVLKLAYRLNSLFDCDANGNRWINFGKLTDTELEESLSDALRSRIFGVPYMESMVVGMLSLSNQRGLDLSETNEETLDEWVANAATDQLRKAGEEYRVRKLCAMPPEAAARQLLDMPREALARYREALRNAEKGEAIMDCYCSMKLSAELSWEEMARVWESVEKFYFREKTREAMLSAGWERYVKLLDGGENAAKACEGYAGLMKTVLCTEGWETPQYQECLVNAREEFWNRQSIQTFRFEDEMLYRQMKYDGSALCGTVLDLFGLEGGFDPENQADYLTAVYRFFTEHPALYGEERDTVLAKLLRSLEGEHTLIDGFAAWVKLAAGAADISISHPDEVMGRLAALCRCTADFRAAEVAEEYDAVLALRELEPFRRGLCRLVERACGEHDSAEKPVPLDLWLLLGKRRSNCFQIFDAHSPAVLRGDLAAAAAESELLKEQEYQNAAQQYLKLTDSRNPEAKAVKRLLAECRQLEKVRKSGGKHLPGRYPGGKADSGLPDEGLWDPDGGADTVEVPKETPESSAPETGDLPEHGERAPEDEKNGPAASKRDPLDVEPEQPKPHGGKEKKKGFLDGLFRKNK